MIEPLRWQQPRIGELTSPFERGKGERPLRITFHSSTLSRLSGDEAAAVQALRELARLTEIEALETEPGDFPHIRIGEFDTSADLIPVEVLFQSNLQLLTGIWFPGQWPEIADHLVGDAPVDHPASKQMLTDLLTTRAHLACHGDLLVTNSPLLLKHRSDRWVREANPRTPTEAARIAGTFLRSRGIHTYRIEPKVKYELGRGLFYWVLARHRLPSMWTYFSACVEAKKARNDDILELGQSILTRTTRALEARDAVIEQFYVPQNNETADRMMYSFDYLTLLLAGALDAQARVAFRTYQLRGNERYATFRDDGFKKHLQQAGAANLHSVVTSQNLKDLTTLLYKPRNTIHGAGLIPAAYITAGDPQATLVPVNEPFATELWEAAQRCGSSPHWGLARTSKGVLLEPSSYVDALVVETFRAIDSIAAATEVQKLFPSGQAVPSFSTAPPSNGPFKEAPRLALLG